MGPIRPTFLTGKGHDKRRRNEKSHGLVLGQLTGDKGPAPGLLEDRREEADRRKLLACVGVPLFMGENCFGMLVILISHDTRAMEAEADPRDSALEARSKVDELVGCKLWRGPGKSR